jgi:DNA excision repair protein ERCC-4
MTEAMRACQDAVTGCMEAMLVELKRDHSLVSQLCQPL